ncbi:MAG: hypothetical protein Q8P67_09890 [archaeon]|nr:hypothetical protein [archaeon]
MMMEPVLLRPSRSSASSSTDDFCASQPPLSEPINCVVVPQAGCYITSVTESFAKLLSRPIDSIVGHSLSHFVLDSSLAALRKLQTCTPGACAALDLITATAVVSCNATLTPLHFKAGSPIPFASAIMTLYPFAAHPYEQSSP